MFFDPTDRAGLKAHAKRCMKVLSPGIYLVSLLLMVLNNAPDLVVGSNTLTSMLQAGSAEQALDIYLSSNLSGSFALPLALLLLNLFLTLVTYGWQLYCLRASRGEEPGGVETLFACFRQLWRFFCAQLLMELFIILWSCLFLIPGIIAIFAYSQTIWIMLDHPEMSPMEAIRASRKLMRGHKWEYFVLELSFYGWMLLSACTLGLLSLWLNPYMGITQASYYNGLVNWQQLPEPQAEPEVSPEEWWKQ